VAELLIRILPLRELSSAIGKCVRAIAPQPDVELAPDDVLPPAPVDDRHPGCTALERALRSSKTTDSRVMPMLASSHWFHDGRQRHVDRFIRSFEDLERAVGTSYFCSTCLARPLSSVRQCRRGRTRVGDVQLIEPRGDLHVVGGAALQMLAQIEKQQIVGSHFSINRSMSRSVDGVGFASSGLAQILAMVPAVSIVSRSVSDRALRRDRVFHGAVAHQHFGGPPQRGSPTRRRARGSATA
jgi:hypothetical protein